MNRVASSLAGLAAALAMVSAGCHHDDGDEPVTAPGACPAPWLEPPFVEDAIAVPPGGGHVVFHATASGTQNYLCTASGADGGASPAWSLVGPEASLSDCKGTTVGRHFATEAGPPEWELLDGSYVVAHKVAAAPQKDAVPWLLLAVDRQAPTGPLAQIRYAQRVRTSGGRAPLTACDPSNAGTTEKIPYTADYYFYGP